MMVWWEYTVKRAVRFLLPRALESLGFGETDAWGGGQWNG